MISSDHIHLLSIQMRICAKMESQITNLNEVSGGSINTAYTFRYANTTFFLKENESKTCPEMFKKEISGLKELKKVTGLVIPEPMFDFDYLDKQFLVLSYLEKIPETNLFFEQLGIGLARLHACSSDKFGFSEDNYIGSLPQINTLTDNWSDFFYLRRLEPLLRWCFDQKYIGKAAVLSFENLYRKLDEVFPNENPALLHGDLWGGNKMNTTLGPAIFDPAVYYGHREMDIAMTRLFGGFDDVFYTAYNSEYPLEKDYKKRTDICNLYPLLVHVKLFGTSYLQDVLTTVTYF